MFTDGEVDTVLAIAIVVRKAVEKAVVYTALTIYITLAALIAHTAHYID